MAATYDSTLPTNKDHVRLLISDTDLSSPIFQDEEIVAILSAETATGESLKYFAAARLLEILHVRYMSKGKGLTEKQVDDLRLRYGVDRKASDEIGKVISSLRVRGAWLLSPNAKPFAAI